MTRKEISEVIFDYIRSIGFTPQNIEYGNGYFMFNMGEDGVCHFTVKGLHNWKFGMWIQDKPQKDNDLSEPAVQFFCQNKLNIDKFKPSYSFFEVDYTLKNIISPAPYEFFQIKEILKMLKKHPIISCVMDYREKCLCEKAYTYVYFTILWYNKKQKIKQWWDDFFPIIWHKPKAWFLRKIPIVKEVKWIDHNTEDFRCFPRYKMIILFQELSGNEEIQEEMECKVFHRFFKKIFYENFEVGLYRDDEYEHPYTYS